MMIGPVMLVVCCTACAGEATIKFEDADAREEAVWHCPRCQTPHPLGIVGRVAWTVKQRVHQRPAGPPDGDDTPPS